MKILIIVTSLMSVALAEDCSSFRCSDLNLTAENPLNINDSESRGNCYNAKCFDQPFQKFEIRDATGSIGPKTFSLMPQLEELEITYSRISSVETGALCALPNLKKLTIELNREFPTLTETSVSNCQNLKELSVEIAQIEQGAYKNLIGLEELGISSQNISHFSKDYLDPLKNLKLFSMFRINVDTIEDGAFCISPHLEVLSFVGNTFSSPLTKQTFENCGNIKKFKLLSNDKVVIADEAFSPFTNAKAIFLSNLKADHLNKNYLKGFQNAETLEINYSGIKRIDGDTFSDFAELRNLSLSSNKLTEVDPDLVRPLRNLFELDLSYNSLTTIDNIVHPTLERLLVNTNCISEVNGTAIKANLPNLKELDLRCNVIGFESRQVLERELAGISTFFSSYPYDSRSCKGRQCHGDFSFLIPI